MKKKLRETKGSIGTCISLLHRKGFVTEFLLLGNAVEDTSTKKRYQRAEIESVEAYTFETYKRIHFETNLMAVKTLDGARGMIVLAGKEDMRNMNSFFNADA